VEVDAGKDGEIVDGPVIEGATLGLFVGPAVSFRQPIKKDPAAQPTTMIENTFFKYPPVACTGSSKEIGPSLRGTAAQVLRNQWPGAITSDCFPY
jgi:hypothetical protein